MNTFDTSTYAGLTIKIQKYIKRKGLPSDDHLGSVGDSTITGSPPATHTRLQISLHSIVRIDNSY